MGTFTTILLTILGLLLISFPFFSRKLAEKSGWRALEENFKEDQASSKIKGNAVNLYSAIIGGLNYTNILRCKIVKHGLYIRLVWPFSLTHKAILVPWKAFKSVEDTKVLLKDYKRFSIGRPTITTIDLDEKGFNLLKKHFRERSRLNV